jgi:hypothetical protein
LEVCGARELDDVLRVAVAPDGKKFAEWRRVGFPSFDFANLKEPATTSLNLSGGDSTDPDRREAFWDQLVNEVEVLPGVESATVGTRLPFLLGESRLSEPPAQTPWWHSDATDGNTRVDEGESPMLPAVAPKKKGPQRKRSAKRCAPAQTTMKPLIAERVL